MVKKNFLETNVFYPLASKSVIDGCEDLKNDFVRQSNGKCGSHTIAHPLIAFLKERVEWFEIFKGAPMHIMG